MTLTSFLIYLFCLLLVVHGFMDTDLALSFFKWKKLRHIIVLTCNDKKAQVQITKILTQPLGILIVIKNVKFLNDLSTLFLNGNTLGVILDGDCKDANSYLRRSNKSNIFDQNHFWLVLFRSSSFHRLFKAVNLNINSDLKVAHPNVEAVTKMQKYIIHDIYNPAFERGGKLRSTKVGIYNQENRRLSIDSPNKYFTRKDLTDIQFKTVIVLPEPFEGTLSDYLIYDREVQINTFNRFHSRLLHYCKDYYNFSMDITLDVSWGYLQSDGTMDGLVGDLQQKKIDFGLSPLFVKKDRLNFIRYGRKTYNLRAAFILRNPKSRKSYQIFIKPLSVGVWICIIFCSMLSVFVQKLGYDLEIKRSTTFNDRSWSFNTICTIGAFCQQGIISFPKSLSGRAAALVTLLLGLLTYQFYSASLMSFLLNVPTTVISTLGGILDTTFRIGCQDILYNRDFLKNENNIIIQEVLRRMQMGNGSGFLKPELGLALVKQGQYAFHVELATAYPIIEQQFDESTICELKEIPMFPVKQMHANYQKCSPFKDLMDVCLHRLSENGVMTRETLFWHPRRPGCIRSGVTIQINTGLADFYPALCILFMGVVLSIPILVAEIYSY